MKKNKEINKHALSVNDFVKILNDANKTKRIDTYLQPILSQTQTNDNGDTFITANIVKLFVTELFGEKIEMRMTFPVIAQKNADKEIISIKTVKDFNDDLGNDTPEKYYPEYSLELNNSAKSINLNTLKIEYSMIDFKKREKIDNILKYVNDVYNPRYEFFNDYLVFINPSCHGYYSIFLNVNRHNNIFDLWDIFYNDVDIFKFELTPEDYKIIHKSKIIYNDL